MANNEAAQNKVKQLSNREISAFCAQIALILQAGITIAEGIEIMRGDAADREGREILDDLNGRMMDGEPFYVAIASCGRFPQYVVDMVEIGETAGRLDKVMNALCDYYDHADNTAQSLKNAIVYPMVMIVMMLLTVLVLVTRVLPIFADVFEQLGSGSSLLSQDMLQFGKILGGVIMALLAIVLILGIAGLIMRATNGGRKALSRVFDSFPLTMTLSSKIASGRFASAMALMLSSGLNMDRAMELAEHLVSNPKIGRKITECKELVESGTQFSDALDKTEIFSGINARMVSVGTKSGAVDQVMARIAERYEYETNDRISHLVSIMEPTLVAVLSIVVGAILISVMLPLMGIMSTIG